ncbi:reverse transcriptase domain-containing protein [Tanacetum coccineum]
MHIYVIRWRQRLDYPERLGGYRWMRVILPAERRQAVISEMLKADQRRSIEMRELRTTDHTRQQQLIQTLTGMQSLQREVTPLLRQVTTLQGQKMAPNEPLSQHRSQQHQPNNQPQLHRHHAQLQAMIDQGVSAALAARDANRNGNDSHTSGTGGRRTERIVRECTYQDFMKCKPLYFKGTEELLDCHQDAAISPCPSAMTWADLRKNMTDKYCPRNEMKKLEAELWNLKVKGTDVIGYNQRYQKLALLYVRMFPEESDKTERYISGLPDMIHGNIVASKSKTMQEAVEMATELMDKKVITIAERQAENKRKGLVKGSHTGDLNPYVLNATITTTVHVLQNAINATKLAILLVTVGVWEMPTMLTIKDTGHLSKNHVGNDRAPAKVYVVGRAGTNPDSNVVTGTFLLNNRYASILFDTGADRSFVSTAFSSQMDITPSTLDHYYDVELADGRIIGLNTILRAIIVCAEKIVRIPWGNETLIVHGDESNQGHRARLQTYHILSRRSDLRCDQYIKNFPEVFPERDLGPAPPGIFPLNDSTSGIYQIEFGDRGAVGAPLSAGGGGAGSGGDGWCVGAHLGGGQNGIGFLESPRLTLSGQKVRIVMEKELRAAPNSQIEFGIPLVESEEDPQVLRKDGRGNS